MLTPQEVSEHVFAKAGFGGYNMAMVDEFLDELTEDYTTLYKENAALKAKLKVLVEKVEDYRATEDSMRATLLTAQRMADKIVLEAEAKRDDMLAQAETAAREKLQDYREQVYAAEERMKLGRLELARFVAESRSICEKQMAFLDQLPDVPVDLMEGVTPAVSFAAEEKMDSAIDEIGEAVLAAFAAAEAEEAEEEAAAEVEEVKEENANPFVAEEVVDPTATRRINLSELKFGRNYKD
jgi:cell division initiation protein